MKRLLGIIGLVLLLGGCALFQRVTGPVQATFAELGDGVSHTLTETEQGWRYRLYSTAQALEESRIVFDAASEPSRLVAYSGGTLAQAECFDLATYTANGVPYRSLMCRFGNLAPRPNTEGEKRPVLDVTFTGADPSVTPYWQFAGSPQTRQLLSAFPE